MPWEPSELPFQEREVVEEATPAEQRAEVKTRSQTQTGRQAGALALGFDGGAAEEFGRSC